MGDEKDSPCPLCNGAEWIRTTDLTSRKCVCLQRKFVRSYLTPAISMATLTPSPLFTPSKDGSPPIDRTEENLFIKGYWEELLGHLKWALGFKYNLNEKHRFRIVTDEKILQVRLGAESYMHRAKDKRDDLVTYNSLHDFIGEGLDLVIIRLGFLGYKNIAMAGYLKEALGIREAALKPTWIVESPKYLFGPGHTSYSEDLEGYIKENFEVVQIESTRTIIEELPGRVIATSVEASGEDDVAMGSGAVTSMEPMPMPEERIKKREGSGHRAFPRNKKGKKGNGGGAGGILE